MDATEGTLMTGGYRFIEVERHGDVVVVTLKQRRLTEAEINILGDEVLRVGAEGSPRIVLNLQPSPEFLYSVFLAKLIALQRQLTEIGGGLKLSGCDPKVVDVFEACQIKDRFQFFSDAESAVRSWTNENEER